MTGKAPTKDVVITFTITEDTHGKLGIRAEIPDHAEGSIALVVANAAMEVMQGMMKDAGVKKEHSYTGKAH